ncbi:MAG: HEAT repeat domain-containing protein [Myxococcota bacterium]
MTVLGRVVFVLGIPTGVVTFFHWRAWLGPQPRSAYAHPMNAPRHPPVTLRNLLLLAVAVVLPATARADFAARLAECPQLELATCPALVQAAAAKVEAVRDLVAVLERPSAPTVDRARAAVALGLLDAREQADLLYETAESLQGDPLRADVLLALARLGDRRAVRPLLDVLGGLNPTARKVAAQGLAMLQSPLAVPSLVRALRDGDPEVAAAAARALGRHGSQAGEPELIALAARPSAPVGVRVAAMDALAAQGALRAAGLATWLVAAPERDLGRAALRLLAAVPVKWAEPAVQFALRKTGLRGEAALAAAALGMKGAAAGLVAAAVATDLQDDEQVGVLQALVAGKPVGAAPALAKRLPSAPSTQQARILRALADLGDPTVVREVVPFTESADPTLANDAVFALENLTGRKLGRDARAWRVLAGLPPLPPVAAPAAPAPKRH